MKKLRKYKERKIIRRLLCLTAAVVVVAGLSIAAAASRTEEYPCPKHQKHDDTCGYVEASGKTEGHPCEHVCAACDPASEIEQKKGDYDKYAESETHQDVKIVYRKNHDSLKDVQTYVYNEDGARGKDEEGEWVKVSLNKDVDYTISEVAGHEGLEQVVFKNTYLDGLHNIPYTYILEFESGNPQEYELTVSDTTPVAETAGESTPEEAQPEGDQSETGAAENQEGQTEKAPEETTESKERASYAVSPRAAYFPTLTADSIASTETAYRFEDSKSNGILSVSIDLTNTGESGRYIVVTMPEYGMVLGGSLPSKGNGVDEVTKIDKRSFRMDISDGADGTLVFTVAYVKEEMTEELEMAWRSGTVPPATGFHVEVYGKKGGSEVLLGDNTYGNWTIDTGSSEWDLIDTNSASGTYVNANYSLGGKPQFGNNLKFNYSGTDPNVKMGYVDAIRIYADEALLRRSLPAAMSPYTPLNGTGIGATTYGYTLSEVRSDAKGSYRELKINPGARGYANTFNEKTTSKQYNSIRWQIYSKFAAEDLTPGTEYEVKAVVVMGNYTSTGVEMSEQEYTLNSVKTKQEVTEDRFAGIVFAGSTYEDYYLPDVDKPNGARAVAGEIAGGGYVRFNNVIWEDATKVYAPSSYYEGLVETYEFPYEFQPRNLNLARYWIGEPAYFRDNNLGINEEYRLTDAGQEGTALVTYYLSDGTQQTVSPTRTETRNGYNDYSVSLDVKFDSLPANTRVTKIEVKWDRYMQYISNGANVAQRKKNLGSSVDVYVMPTDESGADSIGKSVHIKHSVKDGSGNVLFQTTDADEELWWNITEAALSCPEAQWATAPELNQRQYVFPDNQTVVQKNDITIQPDDYLNPPLFKIRDMLTNPKLKIMWSDNGNESWDADSWGPFPDITPEEVPGYVFAGKMTVHPMLAGYTVTYHTRDAGEQTLVLPDSIPAEGYRLELPIADGDRLVGFNGGVNAKSKSACSVVEFTKAGETTGWNSAGTKLISDIEFLYARQKDDGSELMTAADRYEKIRFGQFFATISNDNCTCFNHETKINHTHAYTDADMTIQSGVGINLRNLFYTAFDMEETGILGSAPNMYQDDIKEVSVGGEMTITSKKGNGYDEDYHTYHGEDNTRNQQALYGSDRAYYKEVKPVIYSKLVNGDVNLYSGTGSIEVGYNYQDGWNTLKSVSIPATVTTVTASDGGTWLKFEALNSEKLEFYKEGKYWGRHKNGLKLKITGKCQIYMLPGAVIGANRPLFGDTYIDEDFEAWENAYDESTASDYQKLDVQGLVPDTLDLRGTGDTTTPSLYLYDEGINVTVLQKILSGVRVVPGLEGAYSTITREQDIYPNEKDSAEAMVTFSAENDALDNMVGVFELPKEGKSITGTFIGGTGGEETVTSDITTGLTGPVTILSNGTGYLPDFRYRIGGTWYTEAQMIASGNWRDVEAVEISIQSVPSNKTINMKIPMTVGDKTNTTDLKGYIGGTYRYDTKSGEETGSLVLGTYVYHAFKFKGNVFKDTNENGERDGSEAGLKDITVNLRDAITGDVVESAVTDGNGDYEILTTKGDFLYLDIEVPDGHKLTLQSAAPDLSTTDSDFERENAEYTGLPDDLDQGIYDIGAGIVKLPTITAPDVNIRMEEPQASQVTATWEKETPVIHYDEAVDTGVATITPTGDTAEGQVNPVAPGTTTATAWVENSLGDRVEATYNITVVPREVKITLNKTLAQVADHEYAFVFKFEQLDGAGNVEKTFYQSLKIPQGASSATATVAKLYPANYRVTEVETNWRYDNTGLAAQTVDATAPDSNTPVTFINSRNNDLWSSANAVITNTMKDVTP